MEQRAWGIHWFRRDLRVAGNPALQWSWKQHSGRILCFFCFDPVFLSRPDFSPSRFAFFLGTLGKLRDELRSIGGDLLVLDRGPMNAFPELFAALQRAGKVAPQSVSWNRDYEPFARARDEAATEMFRRTFGVEVHTERDHLLIEPHELCKGDSGGFYQVYSPFAKTWMKLLERDDFRSRIADQKAGLQYLEARKNGDIKKIFSMTWNDAFGGSCPLHDSFEEYRTKNQQLVSIPIPEAGPLEALKRVERFGTRGLAEYADRRDLPGVDGTSRLSLYFKNGSITTSQVLACLNLDSADFRAKDGPTVFLKEIVWREFYYHILWHRPDVEQQSFLEKYRNIEWENDEDLFRAWKVGETGFPIVDAGMRQLNQTGWMHNRVRMIVASFLTKDLHIDWRWGERYFMEKLLDGDLAPNNGGWQWAASTGCDPQPYFRIFNPVLQSERFDPKGDYIRTYVPELSSLKDSQIHEPWDKASPAGYPRPVVEHDVQKQLALELYRRIS